MQVEAQESKEHRGPMWVRGRDYEQRGLMGGEQRRQIALCVCVCVSASGG